MKKDILMPLLDIMRQLRSEEGCPWDREQTHESLRPFAIEESYEVAEAVENQDLPALVDELGDLLLQVVFHAVIGEENREFTMQDVVTAVCTKMQRRHPHVFADVKVDTSAQVLQQWEAIKAIERKNKPKESALDGVTAHLPALMAANKLQSKAAKVGFDWPSIEGVWEKLEEEKAEILEAEQEGDHVALEEEVGDFLFAAVNLARFLQVEPETALLKANQKFKQRFIAMEQAAKQQQLELPRLPLPEQEKLWEAVKKQEKGERPCD